jgi:F-type H+-transporting ATPase subunit alpha
VGGNAQVKAMRKVAGRLRLDLAQFRELEAFAQFGSDLDATTQRQLARGERTVEILKQAQYQPMPVENQVCGIYAVTNGHLDHVPVERVKAWERGFHEHLRAGRPEVLDGIREQGELKPELEEALKAAIRDWNQTYEARETPVGASA